MSDHAQKQIGGANYVVNLVDTSVGVRLAARLVNMLGSAAKGSDASLKGILSGLAANPELGDHLAAFCSSFAQATQVFLPDGKSFTLSTQYEKFFRGKFDDWFAWLEFAFETNMSSFLDVLRPYLAMLGEMQAKAPTGESPFKSPPAAQTTG